MFLRGMNALSLLLLHENLRATACTQDKRLWLWINPWISMKNLWIWIWIWMGDFMSTASLETGPNKPKQSFGYIPSANDVAEFTLSESDVFDETECL